jgi:hypothetical protein
LAYFESCATIVLSRDVEMNYDHDKVDDGIGVAVPDDIGAARMGSQSLEIP